MGISLKMSGSSFEDKGKIFGSSSMRSSSYYGGNNSNPIPNPDPGNYRIINSSQIGEYLIVFINYLDCKNYEGNKILVYEKCTIQELVGQKLVDPHFSDNKSFHSPIGRFEPTPKGWANACLLCEILIKKNI